MSTDIPPADRPEQPPADRIPASAYDDVSLAVAPDVLVRHNARVLDPVAVDPALTDVPNPPPVRSTVYIAHHLLVREATPGRSRSTRLVEAAGRYGLTVEVDERDGRVHQFAAREEIDHYPTPVSLVRLVSAGGEAIPAPNAWAVLQTYRGLVEPNSDERRGRQPRPPDDDDSVRRVHSRTAGSLPTAGSLRTAGSPPTAGSLLTAGSLRRRDVLCGRRQRRTRAGGLARRAAPPHARRPDATRRPVVAVLDTGIGEHDWLTAASSPTTRHWPASHRRRRSPDAALQGS